MAKKKKKAKAAADNVVEMKLPPALYNAVQQLNADNPDYVNEILGLIFAQDEYFGITSVKLTSADAPIADDEGEEEGVFKLCDGG